MRNRRNTRRKNVILETITNKNFIRISSILLVAIIILFGSIKIRNYFDKKELAEQAMELDKQTGEIFTAMETEIKETNTKKDGIKKTSTAKISAVGDISSLGSSIEGLVQFSYHLCSILLLKKILHNPCLICAG